MNFMIFMIKRDRDVIFCDLSVITWLVLIDFLWGRQSTRDCLEIYTDYADLEDRLEELCAVDRDTGRQNFMRPHGEPKTLVFNDDGDFASKDSIFADGRLKDMNHPNRENAIVVCVHRSYTHTQLINTLLVHRPSLHRGTVCNRGATPEWQPASGLNVGSSYFTADQSSSSGIRA